MKWIALLLLVVAAGCKTPDIDIGPIIDAYTNSLPDAPVVTNDAPVTPPTVTPGLIAAGSFVRPAIALGPDGTLYVAAEGPGMASVHLYTGKAGKWAGGQIVAASKDTAGRCYVPDVVPGITSWRWGKKEYGKLHGPGLYADGKVVYPGLTVGAARLAQDGAKTYLLTKNGVWGQIGAQGNVEASGTFPVGNSGEKFAFDIYKGRWAVAINGYSAQASSLTVGTVAGGKRYTWADHGAYPEQGDDLCYPSVAQDRDGTIYCGSVYSGQFRINAFRGAAMVHPVTQLPSLGAASMLDRCPPRLLRGPDDAVWAIWQQGKAIVAGSVKRLLSGGQAARIATGEYPDAVWTGAAFAVVYAADGGLRITDYKH